MDKLRLLLLVLASITTTLSIFTFLLIHHNNYYNSISLFSFKSDERPKDHNNIIIVTDSPPENVTGTNFQLQQPPHQTQSNAASQTVPADIAPKNDSLENQNKDTTSIISSSTTIPNDRFLDGLLLSTFDPPSCLSRYQSYLYRKPSPYKPCAYLISKLRNYELLHTTCGPHTKSYAKLIMTTKKKGTKKFSKNDCKYLVWTPSNGLGNRIITLAAAFLYAILTDRVLLVKFGIDMFGLFCDPFPHSSWLLPRNFPYWKDHKHIQTYETMLINSSNKNNRSNELLPQFLILNLQHSHDARHNNFFHCDQSQGLLHKVPVLILSSDQYFVPSLFMIPSFQQQLSKMFPDKDTVFHHLGRYLFQPSNEAWELITRFYEAHLAKANEKIGLQIRVYNTHQVPHTTVINEILACTLQHKLLPELDAQKTATSHLKKQTSKAVLVASLYSEYGEKLRTMYKANTTVTGEVIKVYQPSHEGRQKSNNDTHNIKAWTEIYLLSLCDVLITSPKSTFGYVAHSLGGLKPWILKRAYGETIPNPPCQRAMSMEPCFHYPPKYDCRANNTVDFTSLYHHMKHCEDVKSGLRLVNANRR
ncbi:probable fucosyltransferase 8 isoform X2 [Trifolium pratense]|uniref:probable fucosyltransferase 8 isoform X2 n=1 Tax=Trifolium pratense TaxID=57577 RepID=UPI001E69166D|nr:probable fucosyltransferase 8 isoform X2 [Trifolium pratense]